MQIFASRFRDSYAQIFSIPEVIAFHIPSIDFVGRITKIKKKSDENKNASNDHPTNKISEDIYCNLEKVVSEERRKKIMNRMPS